MGKNWPGNSDTPDLTGRHWSRSGYRQPVDHTWSSHQVAHESQLWGGCHADSASSAGRRSDKQQQVHATKAWSDDRAVFKAEPVRPKKGKQNQPSSGEWWLVQDSWKNNGSVGAKWDTKQDCWSWDNEWKAAGPKEKTNPEADWWAEASVVPHVVAVMEEGSRDWLINSVFAACDADQDGWLDQVEMRKFAVLSGFEGSEDEWRKEYETLCRDLNPPADPVVGVSQSGFAFLVNNESGNGCYCTDDELREIVSDLSREQAKPHVGSQEAAITHGCSKTQCDGEFQLPTPAASSEQRVDLTRQQIKESVFRSLDVDGDGHLNAQEIKPFVYATGFHGTDADFAEEYRLLCIDVGCDMNRGVSRMAFFSMVDDQSDQGCYVMDGELQGFLDNVAANSAVSSARGTSRDEVVSDPWDAADPWSSTPDRSRKKQAENNVQTTSSPGWTKFDKSSAHDELPSKPAMDAQRFLESSNATSAQAELPAKPAMNAHRLLEASKAANAARKARELKAAKNAKVEAPCPMPVPKSPPSVSGGSSGSKDPAPVKSCSLWLDDASILSGATKFTSMTEALANVATAVAQVAMGELSATNTLLTSVAGAPCRPHALAVACTALKSLLQGKFADTRILLSLDAVDVHPVDGDTTILSTIGTMARSFGPPGAPLFAKTLAAMLAKIDDRRQDVRNAASAAIRDVATNYDPFAFEVILPPLLAALHPKRGPAIKLQGIELLNLCARGPDGRNAVAQKLPQLLPVALTLLADLGAEVRIGAAEVVDLLLGFCTNTDMHHYLREIIQCAQGEMDVSKCVSNLAEVVFVQRVDASALAVVMPVLTKGLRSRNLRTQRQAAVIAENMCRLVSEVADMRMFTPHLVPLLERISDNAADPDVRRVAKRALESLRFASESHVDEMAQTEVREILMQVEEALDSGHSSGDVFFPCPRSVRSVFIDYTVLLCCGLGRGPRLDEPAWVSRLFPLLSPLYDNGTIDLQDLIGIRLRDICIQLNVDPGRAKVGDCDLDAEDPAENGWLCRCSITLACGAATLLSGAQLNLARGRVYGIVGANDTGKSTLLRAIHDRRVSALNSYPDFVSALVEHGMGEQPPECDRTPSQYLLSDPVLRMMGIDPSKVSSALQQMGFDQGGRLKKTILALSGGWRMKLALVKAMLQDADLLLLDEPTGHLDSEHLSWLVEYIKTVGNRVDRVVTVLVVSHDSCFLDNVCSHIIHVDEGKLKTYAGNFADFTTQVPGAVLGTPAPAEMIVHVNAGAPSEVKDSVPLVENQTGEVALEDDTAEDQCQVLETFVLPDPGFMPGLKSKGKRFLFLENVFYTYPDSPGPAVRLASVECSLKSRVGIIGPNGAGKSTLAALVVGELAPQMGHAWRHPNLRMAFVAQHSFHHLETHMDLTATQYILQRFEGNEDREALDFRADEAEIEDVKSFQFESGKLVECALDDPNRAVPEVVEDRRQRGHKGYEYEVRWRGLKETTWLSRQQLASMGRLGMAKRQDERQAAQRALVTRALTTPGVEAHLAGFGLGSEEASHRRLGTLSSGQRARVVLGAATWLAPHLLVLDEPTNYIDRPALAALIAGLRNFAGGVMVISHTMAFVDEVCSERWVMEHGSLRREGTQPPNQEDEGVVTVRAPASALTTELKEKKRKERLKKLRRKKGADDNDDSDGWYQDLLEKSNPKATKT